MKCIVYMDDRDYRLTIIPTRVWMPTERDYLASSSIEHSGLPVEWFTANLQKTRGEMSDDEFAALVRDFGEAVGFVMDHPIDSSRARKAPDKYTLRVEVPEAYFERSGYVCCTPATAQITEILAEAAEDGCISCRDCEASVDLDAAECDDCGWKNPLVARALI